MAQSLSEEDMKIIQDWASKGDLPRLVKTVRELSATLDGVRQRFLDILVDVCRQTRKKGFVFKAENFELLCKGVEPGNYYFPSFRKILRACWEPEIFNFMEAFDVM